MANKKAQSTIAGLKELNFLGMQTDMSMSVEQISFELLRQLPRTTMKVPRMQKALVYLNATFYGILDHVEVIDEDFVATNWGTEANGGL